MTFLNKVSGVFKKIKLKKDYDTSIMSKGFPKHLKQHNDFNIPLTDIIQSETDCDQPSHTQSRYFKSYL